MIPAIEHACIRAHSECEFNHLALKIKVNLSTIINIYRSWIVIKIRLLCQNARPLSIRKCARYGDTKKMLLIEAIPCVELRIKLYQESLDLIRLLAFFEQN